MKLNLFQILLFCSFCPDLISGITLSDVENTENGSPEDLKRILYPVLSEFLVTEEISPKCFAKLQSIVTKFLDNTGVLLNFLLDTGIGVNNFGDFDACKKSPVSTYYTMYIELGIRAKMGLCIPNECGIADLELLNGVLASALTSFVGMTITPDNISWVDPVTAYEDATNKDWAGYIITIIIFIIPILLFLSGSLLEIYAWYLKKGEEQNERDKLIDPKPPTKSVVSVAKGSELSQGIKVGEKSPTSPKSPMGGDMSLAFSNVIPKRKSFSTKLVKFLQCFSLVKNADNILHAENRVDKNLDVLNGARVLAMGWVMMGHAYSNQFSAYLRDAIPFVDNMINSYGMTILTNAPLSVDVFFFFSGFLCTFQLTQQYTNKKNRGILHIVKAFTHRYIRLLPLFGLSILFTIYVFPRMAEGPIYTRFGNNESQLCKDQWWKSLLYINNLFTDTSNYCNVWTWYLPNDMQFFLLTPLILIPYSIKQLYGYISIAIFFVISFTAQINIILAYDIRVSRDIANPEMSDADIYLYGKPWVRIPAYLVGILMCWGFLNFKKHATYPGTIWKRINRSTRYKRWFRYGMYFGGLVIMYNMIFTLHYFNKDYHNGGTFWNCLYEVVERPLFVIGLGLCLYPVLLDRGKPILAILGYPVFNALARLTYGAYMIHEYVYKYLFWSSKEGRFFSHGYTYAYIGYAFIFSYVASFFFTLVYESPVIQLEKIYLFPPPPRKVRGKSMKKSSVKRMSSRSHKGGDSGEMKFSQISGKSSSKVSVVVGVGRASTAVRRSRHSRISVRPRKTTKAKIRESLTLEEEKLQFFASEGPNLFASPK